jgi:hypothetical protein
MRTVAAVGVVAAVLGVPVRADDAPPAPTPQKQHEWLAQLAGEWTTDAECVMAPGQPPVKMKGTESVRLLGGLWAVSEMKGEVMGVPMTGVMQIGYDPKAGKYVGTFVCSAGPELWRYEGTVDGNKLTLNTEGPHMVTGKPTRMKDVIEIKNKDEKVMTSHVLGDDGKWVQFMTMTARRKK